MFDIFYSNRRPNLLPHAQEASGIKHAQQLSRTRYFWWVNYLTDYTGWDFLWEPPPWQAGQRHAWPSQWQKDSGTYLVPKLDFQDTNYHVSPLINRLSDQCSWQIPDGLSGKFDYSWHPDATDPALIYQFGTQWQKTGGPRYVTPGATETKYVTSPRAEKISQDPSWEVPNGTDIASFDWTWHPDATDPALIYQFGTQWQKTGGPRYVMSGATETKYVDQLRIKTQRVASVIIEIDHLDGNAGQIPNTTCVSRYFDNYLDTLKRIATNIDTHHEFAWICSSICDYKDFDWSWHPEQWQATMLHVFASDGEKFGDTFFMHVPTFRHRAKTCQLLEWYDVNFIETTSVPRRPIPVIRHQEDSHVQQVRNQNWNGPLALFTNCSDIDGPGVTVPLWRENTKTIVPLSSGGHSVIVPRTAVPYVKTQLYDYPYIDRSHQTLQDAALDVIFISNGEHGADHHYDVLTRVLHNHGSKNRLHRIDGVNGRIAAYRAAANQSQTSWFFAVFAKLQVNEDFNWAWQPDRLQEAKHYIFHAENPVNGLVYGHQAVIAYNRSLTLINPGLGLDFTLDNPHEVVPILSGTAHYNKDAWTCWRTAFREVLKLRHSLPDVENQYRLNQWLKENNSDDYAKWSHLGAQDAMEYYDNVQGEFAALKKSYEWSWLASYALLKRNLTPNRLT